MTRYGEILFPLGVLAFLAVVLLVGGIGLRHPAMVIAFPLGVGIVTGALCVAVAVRDGNRPAATAAGQPIDWSEAARVGAVLPLVLLLGFSAGLAVYLAGYLRWRGEGWGMSLGCAAGSVALTYGVFVKLLAVPLPLIPWWLP